MKATKRISAIFLALVLVLSLLPVSVFAAGSDYSTRLLVNKVADDKVDVKWMVQTSNGAVMKTVNSIIFKYDNTKYDMLTNDGTVITTKTMSNNLFDHYMNSDGDQIVTTINSPSVWNNSGIYTEAKGTNTFVLINLASGSNTKTREYTTETALAVIHLKLKSGAVDDGLPGGSIALADTTEAKNCAQSGIVIFIGTGEEKFIYGRTDGTADTLLTTPVVAPGAGVTFTKPAYSGTIDAPTVTTNAGGKVVLNAVTPTGGPGGETVQYGYSKTNDGKNITWQDGTTFSGLNVGDTLYFYAKVVGTSSYAEKVSAASGKVIVADKALTSIAITGGATADVPTKGNTATVTLTATGNYDDSTTGDITAAAAWTVDPAYAGVSVSKGVVTIAPEATAGNVTIKAEKDGKSGTHSIVLSKASPALASMTISGADSVAVPPATSSPREVTYTVSGKDQFGAAYTPTTVAWSIDGTTPGVSITSDGKLKVENTASEGSVTIKAVSGSIPATKTVSITKAAPAVDSVTISGGVANLTVPTVDAIGGSKSENASAAFTAELKDQYGATISGTVTWSVSGNPGVTISDTGLLSISNKATDSNVTVKAECGSKSATQTVSVTKATSVATFVQVSKSGSAVTTDTIIIPTSSNTTADYTAKVYDQFGATFSDTINWSITSVSGVSVSNGTVTVDSTASAGTVKLTAASSSDSSKKAEVTITLSNKPAHNIGTFADANKTITYGDSYAGQTVSSTTGTVKYSSSDSSAVSVNESTGALTIHKATSGAVTITATVEETSTYAEAAASYTITVNKKELVITGLTATNRDYAAGSTTVALTGGKLTGIVGEDDVSVTMPTSGTMTDANAGSGKAVTVTTPTLSGVDKDNYTLKAISGITVNINKIDPDVGTVSGPSSTIYTSTALTGITLSKTGTASGTLELTAGQTLTTGTSDYNWTFIPSDTTNYNTLTGTVSLTVNEDTLTGISIGSTTPSRTSYKFGETFNPAGLTVTASYSSGASKTLTSSEYTVTNGTMTMGQTEVTLSYQGQTCTVSGLTVSKADAPTLPEVAVSQRYTVTTGEKALGNAGMPANAGTLTYTKGSESKTGSVTVSSWAVDTNGKVTYTLSSGAAGDTVTLPVTISSTNYGDATVNVKITLTDKETPTANANNITVTYTGSDVPASAITGTASVDGAWSWKTTAPKNVSDSGSHTVVFTPNDASTYESVEATITVTINKATPTGTPTYTAITTSGKTLGDAALAVGSITPAGGSIAWNLGDSHTVAANTSYNWTYTPADTANYNNLTGSIELWHKSTGGGGGSYTPSYTVSVDKTENGTITVSPKSASKGDTVTITVKPDKGYELEMLKALDKDGDALKLTEKNGKYTFKMPSGKVTVKGSFVEEAPVQIFKDVPVDAYYYEAVKWAAEKGITGGVGNGLFAPNQPCTRGQIVTFLWRAAGSPEAKAMSAFSDVADSAYYAKAVAWAVENGITGGTGNGKFSPDATCTRAQAVTFLYRAAGSPKVSGNAEFGDVATNAYYADAVAWAAKNGITGGIGGGLFGSDNDCTRAQIVTFLYRSVK